MAVILPQYLLFLPVQIDTRDVQGQTMAKQSDKLSLERCTFLRTSRKGSEKVKSKTYLADSGKW